MVVPARREADARRLERSPVDRLSRGAAQDLPRDAWRRRRAVGADLRAAGLVGGAALRRGRARCGVGWRAALDDGRAGGTAYRGAEDGERSADREHGRAARRRRGGGEEEIWGV